MRPNNYPLDQCIYKEVLAFGNFQKYLEKSTLLPLKFQLLSALLLERTNLSHQTYFGKQHFPTPAIE